MRRCRRERRLDVECVSGMYANDEDKGMGNRFIFMLGKAYGQND